MRKFFKSITNRAYTWYFTLKLGSVHDWEQLMPTFKTKFFYAEAKFSLTELCQTRQHLGNDLDAYVRRFHEKAMDRCDSVAEEVLSNIWFHSMVNKYITFLENLSFLSFSVLMEVGRRTSELVCRTSRSFSTITHITIP